MNQGCYLIMLEQEKPYMISLWGTLSVVSSSIEFNCSNLMGAGGPTIKDLCSVFISAHFRGSRMIRAAFQREQNWDKRWHLSRHLSLFLPVSALSLWLPNSLPSSTLNLQHMAAFTGRLLKADSGQGCCTLLISSNSGGLQHLSTQTRHRPQSDWWNEI